MARTIKEFLEENLSSRDLMISRAMYDKYLTPLNEVWGKYVDKKDILLLAIVLAQKFDKEITKNPTALDCIPVDYKGDKRDADIGRLSGFSEESLVILLSIMIQRHGMDKVVSEIDKCWEDIPVLAATGLKFLYCNIFKAEGAETEIYMSLLDTSRIEF